MSKCLFSRSLRVAQTNLLSEQSYFISVLTKGWFLSVPPKSAKANFSSRLFQLTPVFIFERLCNLIYPEETDTGEFFMTLEKDPQQEDFLQVSCCDLSAGVPSVPNFPYFLGR